MSVAASNPETRRLASEAGVHARLHGRVPDDLKRDLLAARLEDHIKKLVDGAPELTAAQRDKIAILLRPSPSQPQASAAERTGGADAGDAA